MPLGLDRRFLESERQRLLRFQYQHRGLNFAKLWLPPTSDRKVQIIGHNNYVYKGQIPTVPLDQLPPEVQPDSLDEEKLYQEIRDMKFSNVPSNEPLGPRRRIAGDYTRAKRLNFAPIRVLKDEEKISTPIVGADGKIYRGTAKAIPVFQLDRKLRGSKRPVRTPALFSSSRGTVEPTIVSLYVGGKSPDEVRAQVPLIELPISDLNKMIQLIRKKEQEKHRRTLPSEGSKAEQKNEEDSGRDSEDTSSEKSEDEEEASDEGEESSESEAEAEEILEPGVEGEEIVEPGAEAEEIVEPGAEAEEIVEPGAAAEEIVEPGAETKETIEPGAEGL